MATATMQLTRPTIVSLAVTITGTTPLITHAWSQKARRMMLDAQQGKKNPKQPKNPEQDFLDSQYHSEPEGWHGFPTLGVKSAVVTGAGRMFGKSVKMTELRQALFMVPDGYASDGTPLSRLSLTEEPTMREDLVRVGMGTADLRYRAMYSNWALVLTVEYPEHLLDESTVVSLIDAGGRNGIGEWRPERDGSFGTFEVTGVARIGGK